MKAAGCAAPESERLTESTRSDHGATVRKRCASFLEKALEAVEIELAGIGAKAVAAALRMQLRIPLDEPAQARDDNVDRISGRRRRRLTPESRAQLVTRDAAVRIEQEQGERDPLSAAAERQRAFLSTGLERAEDSKLQPHFALSEARLLQR